MKLSEHFNQSEFECKCGCEMPVFVQENIIDLAENLEALRCIIDKPIHITNAYRCEEHNASIGSKSTSQHILGKAADIKVKGYSPKEVADVAEDLMDIEGFVMGGVGRYNTFTHVDIRGEKARWDNTTKQ
jgi:uncharacterized protein YcbK (DUF882 family)